MSSTSLKKTPLFTVHEQLGARMIPFAGFLMPVQYSSVIEEHLAVRTAVGLFDVSHMGEFQIEGSGATESLDRIVTNEIRSLEPGRARYTVMLNEEGGILDDLLVYRMGENSWGLVVNAANIEKDRAWIESHLHQATLRDQSDATALLAVQGPKAVDVMEALFPGQAHPIRYYRFIETRFRDFPVVLSRTGYTGEDGFEVYIPAEGAIALWEAIITAGEPYSIRPCGLGARDTLRLEAGMLLYGQDMDERVTPFDVGLQWVVKLDKGEFIGREVLLEQQKTGPRFRLVGFEMEDPGIARHDYPVFDSNGDEIGRVTSGTHAPFLRKNIGLARVPYSFSGDTLYIQIRQRRARARVVPLPFYKRPK